MAKKKSTGTGKSRTKKRSSEARVPTTRGGTGSRSRKQSRSGSRSSSRSASRSTGDGSWLDRLRKLKGQSASSTGKNGGGSSRKASPQKPVRRPVDWRPRGMGAGFLLVGIGVLALLGLISPNRGQLTGSLLDFLWGLFGWGMPLALAAVLLAGFWLILWGIQHPPSFSPLRLLGLALLFLSFEAFATMIAAVWDGQTTYEAVLAAQAGGGWIGYMTAQGLRGLIGIFGTVFVLTVIGVAGVAMATGMRWEDVQELINREPQPAGASQAGLPLFERQAAAKSEAAPAEQPVLEKPRAMPVRERPVPADEGKRRSRVSPRKKPAEDQKRAPVREPSPPQPIFLGREADQVTSWQLPELAEMLHLGSDSSADNTHVHQQALIIEETLNSFGAPGQVVDIRYGPTIIQYCVEPRFLVQRNGKRTKVKVGKIASLADDLALALAARSVRIQAPVPGRPYVGIEVPNEAKSLVSLRDVMESEEFAGIARKTTLAIGLGEDVAGQPMSLDLAKMPHMLIAGATGSGKSVCVNAVIACLLLQNSPEDLKLVMVDPKRVELTGYNGIPHLAAPVVVDMERVVGTLQWAMREMDSRYQLFSSTGARNIADYNKKAKRQHQKKLPFIVIIIDELADLMMMAPEETERAIARLAQMARATGIHMILATQRPSVDVVTGLIKANFPARIAFAVASSTDSRVVLDTTGAERLLGQGDMLFQSPDAPAPVRMQGCFVSDGELNKIIDYWKMERRRAVSTDPAGEGRQVNVITAATDAIKKEELNQAVWDQDTAEEKTAKTETLKQIEAEQARTAPPTRYSEQAPADANPLTPDDLDEEEEAKLQARRRQAMPTQAPKRETRPAAPPPPVKPAPVEETDVEEDEEDEEASALWTEMTDELLEEQEKAIISSQFGDDELWDDAVEVVKQLGKASTSLLQRRFRIGYTRAARLIDRMEEEGIIGPMPGNNQARELIDEDDDG